MAVEGLCYTPAGGLAEATWRWEPYPSVRRADGHFHLSGFLFLWFGRLGV